jgi:hypothetical protein
MDLNSKNVDDVFKFCLFNDGEDTKEYKVGEGVGLKVGFHPGRLLEKSDVIDSMLSSLPDSFKQSGGGGMSFLNMCQDKDGNLWTGDHSTVDQLLCLGNALGKADFVLPRGQMWSIFPGGMPYIRINQ